MVCGPFRHTPHDESRERCETIKVKGLKTKLKARRLGSVFSLNQHLEVAIDKDVDDL